MTPMPDTENSSSDEKALIDAIMGGAGEAKVVNHKPRKPRAKKPPGAPKKTNQPKVKGVQDWGDMPAPAEIFPADVEKWNNRHWRKYFDDHLERRYGIRTCPGIAAVANAVKEVKRKLAGRFGGNCPQAAIRDYIDYFFEHEAEGFVRKQGNVIMTFLGYDRPIFGFAGRIDAARSHQPNASAVPAEPAEARRSITSEEIEAKAKVSFQGVLTTYGLIVAVNWVVVSRKVTVEKAVTAVTRASTAAVTSDRKWWLNIASATEKNGPYPAWLGWADANAVTAAVECAAGGKLKRIAVESCAENAALDFLKTT